MKNNGLKKNNRNKNIRNLEIFDTTLRDGEQTPEISFPINAKLEIASKLDELGVDVIEAGFPISSNGEFEAVKKIKQLNLNAKICGLSRCQKGDIDTVIDCDLDNIHLFIATSKLHREYKLKKSKEQILQIVSDSITYAKEHGLNVEFSAEDATRTELDYLTEVYTEAISSKTDYIDIPDTVGILTPKKMEYLIKNLTNKLNNNLTNNLTNNLSNTISNNPNNKNNNNLKMPNLSVHCHNDFGLAVANSLTAFEQGVSQVHCTINGIGERAGNTDLAELVSSLKFLYDDEDEQMTIRTNIKTELLYDISKLVSHYSNISIAPNKPLVGRNAFAHESGIHTHGVIENALTYEPIDPKKVGNKRRLVLGKHAGTHSIKLKLEEMGLIVGENLSNEQFEEIVIKIKALGDKGKLVLDADLRAIIKDVTSKVLKSKRVVNLEQLAVVTGINVIPTASVAVNIAGKRYKSSQMGVGPVDASLKALESVVGETVKAKLIEYTINAATGGSDAIADVTVKLENNKKIVTAKSTSEDVVHASVEAVIEGINRLLDESTID
ncbi:2-isopropylmalate synthase [Methanococcus voltae PS]|uniref:2-isopropylmalate synthase n=1 Tax=Methanococcus voltae PS TaxID=523842 RepID=A0ABT2EW69_METVO|nr:2-isopropylmalate synthase [Methanococcus voltae]MCS3922206.1 2-isopropylmalate synthase [Methanococcus voltae PS]